MSSDHRSTLVSHLMWNATVHWLSFVALQIVPVIINRVGMHRGTPIGLNPHRVLIPSCWLAFAEKLSEANRKYASLQAELQQFLAHEHHQRPTSSVAGLRLRSSVFGPEKRREPRDATHTRKLPDLKLAFSEYYLSLILLQNFQTLNFTGFRKILKKHDKVGELVSSIQDFRPERCG